MKRNMLGWKVTLFFCRLMQKCCSKIEFISMCHAWKNEFEMNTVNGHFTVGSFSLFKLIEWESGPLRGNWLYPEKIAIQQLTFRFDRDSAYVVTETLFTRYGRAFGAILFYSFIFTFIFPLMRLTLSYHFAYFCCTTYLVCQRFEYILASLSYIQEIKGNWLIRTIKPWQLNACYIKYLTISWF